MSGGARRGSPASLSLLLLAASLLAFAPAALASVPRGATALPSPLLSADVDALATPQLEHTDSAVFRVFAGDELGTAPFRLFELSYPETRVRGFGLPDEARVGAERTLRLDAPWACDERSGGKASGSGEFRIFDPANSPRSASAFGWNRLFQGREYIGLIDAYDFRARVLWPELGRFGQEDPAGFGDSPNLYQALAGAWDVCLDPDGRELLFDEMLPSLGKPYNWYTGTQAHALWARWLRKHKPNYMGPEGSPEVFGRAFYNRSVNTISWMGAGRPPVSGMEALRPDAARVERDPQRTVSVWELKPETYDPGARGSVVFKRVPQTIAARFGSGSYKFNLARSQLLAYKIALRPARDGDSTALNQPDPGDDLSDVGMVVGRGGKSYRMYVYSSSALNKHFNVSGLVFYYLIKNGKESRAEAFEKAVDKTLDAFAEGLSEMIGISPGRQPVPAFQR